MISNILLQIKKEEAVKAQYSSLLEGVHLIKPALEVFQQNQFAGVSNARQITIQDLLYPSRTVAPHLRLRGCWLRDFGFHPFQKIRVLPFHELLIICPEVPSMEQVKP